MAKSAGAGRGYLNPQRTDESDADYVTPKQHYDMRKEQLRAKESEEAEKSYTAATKNMKSGGHVHHSAHYGKHAAGHELNMNAVKKMCGGGMYKK
jgi:hypothetical protein